MPDAVRVQGLTGLRRAFRAAGRAESRELTRTLREAAEPVRSMAEGLAFSSLKYGRIPWGAMRVGTTAHAVYVAPRQRRSSGTARPNLAPKMLSDSLLPSLSANVANVEREVDQMLEKVGRVWETTG